MSKSALAEIYFMVAMMILIFVVSGVAVYFFFRTLKKERLQKEKRDLDKQTRKTEIEN